MLVMDRIREVRRGTVAAANGSLSRKRQKSSSFRDSSGEDGAMEMLESALLRDCGDKKYRDFNRSTSRNRRRGGRMLHGRHREDDEESSEESVDEDKEEDNSSVAIRLPVPSVPNSIPSTSLTQSLHLRKGFAAKPAKPPGTGPWKVVEEMIGAPIPRKARSSAVKRSQECSVLGGGGGACGEIGREQPHCQTSSSPVRPSFFSTTLVSPTSSTASIRKKMNTITGTNHRVPKTSKSSSIQEIEIEVAEVLFGMTRQANYKNDMKESIEVKFGVSSPIPISPLSSQSPALVTSNTNFNPNQLMTTAPKRKRPRMRIDMENSPTTPSSAAVRVIPNSPVAQSDFEEPQPPSAGERIDPTSPVENKMAPRVTGNGDVSCELGDSIVCSTTATLSSAQQDSVKPEDNAAPDPKDIQCQPEIDKEGAASPPKESPAANLDASLEHLPTNKDTPMPFIPREEKLNIDLMVPLPEKSSSEKDSTFFYVAEHKTIEMVTDSDGQKEKIEKNAKMKPKEIVQDFGDGVNLSIEESDSKKQAGDEKNFNLQLDLEKNDKDAAGACKHHPHKPQSRGPRADSRAEKTAPAESFPLPMQIPGWPGSFPSFGYMGQARRPPFVPPNDAIYSSSKPVKSSLASHHRPRRCSTHCFIAQNIHYHQQITRLNPCWPSTTFYPSKQYNLSNLPSSDSAIFGNKNLGSAQEKDGPSMDSSQKKSPTLLWSSQPESAGNMLAPAFVFPVNQQRAATAGDAAVKLTGGFSNVARSSSGTDSNGRGNTSMSLNYPVFPLNEAQYIAFLQNSVYPFPIPAPVNGASPYRGATPAQVMPYFNFPFYPPQMFHPPQLQQHPPPLQKPPCSQQGIQNPSTSSGSSSSPKNTEQSKRAVAITAGNSHGFPHSKQQLLPQQAGQLESVVAGKDNASSMAKSRVSHAQKIISTQQYAIHANSKNLALVPPAMTSIGFGGSSQGEKQQQQISNKATKMDLAQSQALAMSFASFSGDSFSPGASAFQGVDFSSIAQNHRLLQSLPETGAGHNFHKKNEVGEETKFSSVSNVMGTVKQHSLTISMTDAERPPLSSILSNGAIGISSQSLNIIQPPSSGAAPSSVSSTTGLHTPNSHNLQQVLQLQRRQQQRVKSASSLNNAGVSGNSNASKFPQALAGFSPAHMQSSASTQSPQSKAPPRQVMTASSVAAPSPSASSSSVKNQMPLQQHPLNQLPSAHQTHISFGVNPVKVAAQAGQQHLLSSCSSNTVSLVSAAATVSVESPHSLASKNSASCPPSSAAAKSALPVMPLHRQQPGKNSLPSSSTITPLSGRGMPSILGNPHINSASTSSTKFHPSHQQPKQHLPQPAQFYFSNPYPQSQTTTSETAVAYFQQCRQADLNPSQKKEKSTSSSFGVGDPANAKEASQVGNSQRLMSSSLIQQQAQFAVASVSLPSGGYPLGTAAASAFPYVYGLQSVTLKPATATVEQKPVAGSETCMPKKS